MIGGLDRRERLIARARQGFRLTFGNEKSDPARFFAAPGRINLMGDLVDFSGGFALSCAINRETIVSLSPSSEVGGRGFIEAVAIDMGQARDKFALNEPIVPTGTGWQDLLRAIVMCLQADGHEVLPARLAIASDVPIGVGLASSASLAVCLTLALVQHSRIALGPTDIASIAQRVERSCSASQPELFDHVTSALARKAHALLVDCATMQSMPIPVSSDLDLVIVNTGTREDQAKSDLAERRKQCEHAARKIGVGSLRDATPEMLAQARDGLDRTIFSRARHVVSEIARVEPFAVALAQGDVATLNQLMRDSHVSMRDDFEVSTPVIDELVETIGSALGSGQNAVGGVRMTGIGYGGCIIALTQKDAAEVVIEVVEKHYNPKADRPVSAGVYAIGGGAREATPRT